MPYDHISPHLRRAVLIAEDDAFYSHDGLDWNEIRRARARTCETGRIVRGGSTITQQLAKNLWLGTGRSPMRKIEEVMLAVRLERALSQAAHLRALPERDRVGRRRVRRGRGGAALVPHPGRRRSSARESVRLAAVIINPRRYSPVEPPRRIERRARIIAARMRRRGELADADFREVLGLPPEPADRRHLERAALRRAGLRRDEHRATPLRGVPRYGS